MIRSGTVDTVDIAAPADLVWEVFHRRRALAGMDLENQRLTFGAALPGDGMRVDGWLTEVQSATDTAADPAVARLGPAVMRGLLLDLAGTNDDAGVDAAAQHVIDVIDARENTSS